MAWVRKTCWRCKADKPVAEFNRDASRWDGLRATCRSCSSGESASYRLRNLTKVRAREKAFNASRPVNVRDKSRKYYATHKAEECQRSDSYRRANLTKYAEAEARRRALIRATEIVRVDYERIKIRDRMVCHICRKPVQLNELHFDHVVPLSKGGPHVESNIAVSHANCNRSKSARLMTEVAS